ncbi:hypothetical protein HK100_008848 [Physocladia obscura]|uniref:Uncharacterized protein n=1 Tax=Physocladia obscura TaxID=109957 RepID=A0AAD5SQ83_9FUNG|nr:hypothetical protein HK100_008848 [Physocladia obscura]
MEFYSTGGGQGSIRMSGYRRNPSEEPDSDGVLITKSGGGGNNNNNNTGDETKTETFSLSSQIFKGIIASQYHSHHHHHNNSSNIQKLKAAPVLEKSPSSTLTRPGTTTKSETISTAPHSYYNRGENHSRNHIGHNTGDVEIKISMGDMSENAVQPAHPQSLYNHLVPIEISRPISIDVELEPPNSEKSATVEARETRWVLALLHANQGHLAPGDTPIAAIVQASLIYLARMDAKLEFEVVRVLRSFGAVDAAAVRAFSAAQWGAVLNSLMQVKEVIKKAVGLEV